MLERGVTVSYETVRRWCGKFGQRYASALRRRRPRPGDKWLPAERVGFAQDDWSSPARSSAAMPTHD
ncbi:hypothetical protein SALBM311S_09819 [Streptomyces alboniger]